MTDKPEQPTPECAHCHVGGAWMQTLHAFDEVRDQEFSRRVYLHMDCIAAHVSQLPVGTHLYDQEQHDVHVS